MNIKNVQSREKLRDSDKRVESYSDDSIPVKKDILGVGITSASKESILEYIIKNCKKPTKPYYVVTPNPEMIVASVYEKRLRDVINSAKIALADGIGVVIGSWLLGKGPMQRYAGIDLVKNLCERVNDQPITVGFLGGEPKVAEKTADCLRRQYPGLKVSFIGEEWDSKGFVQKIKGTEESAKGKEKGDAKLYPSPNTLNPKVDILFVAFGVPKQEFFMKEHVGEIPVNVMVGVGGAFDYISGKVVRAPKILQQLGLEWLFRLIVQPWRIKRQLALPIFAWMILKERLKLAFKKR